MARTTSASRRAVPRHGLTVQRQQKRTGMAAHLNQVSGSNGGFRRLAGIHGRRNDTGYRHAADSAPERAVLAQGRTQRRVPVHLHEAIQVTPRQANAHAGEIQAADILDHPAHWRAPAQLYAMQVDQ